MYFFNFELNFKNAFFHFLQITIEDISSAYNGFNPANGIKVKFYAGYYFIFVALHFSSNLTQIWNWQQALFIKTYLI
jgi:hypothetical protein